MMIFRLWQNALMDKVHPPLPPSWVIFATAWCDTDSSYPLRIEHSVKKQEMARENNLNHCYLLSLNIEIYLDGTGAEMQQLSIIAIGSKWGDETLCQWKHYRSVYRTDFCLACNYQTKNLNKHQMLPFVEFR